MALLGPDIRLVRHDGKVGDDGRHAPHDGSAPRDDLLPMSPHVLFVGGEDHALRIPFLLALQQRGVGVSVAASGDPAPFAQAGLDCHAFRFGRFASPREDLRATAALARLIRSIGPDLVQCFDTKPNFLVPLAARWAGHANVVRTINGMGWVFSSRSAAALALRPVYCGLHRLVAGAADATIFQNREDLAFFERHHLLGVRRGRLIPGSGVDVAAFDRAHGSRPAAAALRAQLGLGSAPVVLTVTRLTRQKGIPTLLQAAALVHAARPDVRFLLVGPREGEGPFAVTEREIEAHAPYVVATGRRTDVPDLLGLADVFAFPTEYREGVPRAVLEAALAGLPIIATRMPGCTDVVRHGQTGFLVPPRSPASMAARILDTLADPVAAAAMGARAAALVREEFALDLTVGRYVALYNELMAAPRRPNAAPTTGLDAVPAMRSDAV